MFRDSTLVCLVGFGVVVCGCVDTADPPAGSTDEASGDTSSDDSVEELIRSTDAPTLQIRSFELGAGLGYALGVEQIVGWGYGPNGEFGDGSASAHHQPFELALNGLADVSIGANHVCGVSADGEVACWGDNYDGQVDGAPSNGRSAPTLVPLPGDLAFVDVEAGASSTCALAEDGSVWCWGSNHAGQLGAGTGSDETGPTPVSGDFVFETLVDGSVFSHCGIDSLKRLVCWGARPFVNSEGEIDRELQPVPIVEFQARSVASAAVSAVNYFAIDESGELWVWGVNDSGQLGIGDLVDRTSPTRVSGKRWQSLSASRNLTCAVSSDDELYCWGRVGTPVDEATAGLEGGGYGLMMSEPSSVPVRGPGGGWADVECSNVGALWERCCGLQRNGDFWCWGDDTFGQIGEGDASYQLRTPAHVLQSP